METALRTEHRDDVSQAGTPAPDALLPPAARVEPDLEFIRILRRQAGDTLGKCMQCGTCSATCALSPDERPFPRKEMAWALWGMKDRLLADPDVWLCSQCNDCSTRCPRGARPGDVLAAVRQQTIEHYAVPRFLASWVRRPHALPLLLGIPAALLAAALAARSPLEGALDLSREAGPRILYSYSAVLPHWLLNAVFGLIGLFAAFAAVSGAMRFWRAMSAFAPSPGGSAGPGPIRAVLGGLRRIVLHDDLAECTASRTRLLSHMCVMFGFIALALVSVWVVTARYNPIVAGSFVYPFAFWSPWKLLANAGGVAVLAGCVLMVRDRVLAAGKIGHGSYFDGFLIAALALATISGFLTEVLHYLRLEPHRHLVYFAHLVLAGGVLLYLPHSKLAHVVYRTTAVVFSERYRRSGRGRERRHG